MRILRLEIWGSIAAILITFLIQRFKPLTASQFAILLLSLEGLILLASSISFQIPPIGNSTFGKLKWAILEFPKYGSPASFNPTRFYLGLIFLVVSAVIDAVSL